MDPLKTIERTIKILTPLIENKTNESLTFPKHFTFFLVLERIKLNLESIETLLNNSIIKHEHAIGLISRNLLSDFIVSGFIIKLSDTEDKCIENLYTLYNDDLKRNDAFVKMFYDAKIITDNEKMIIENKHSEDNHIYKIIRDYAQENNLKRFPTTKDIVEKFLKSNKNDEWIHEMNDSYDIWVYLGKYEHLGWGSYELTRDTGINVSLERLNNILYKALIMIQNFLEILQENDLLKEIELLKKEVK